VSALLQDLRFAVRQLAKSPATTAIAVLALALGIGANTSALSGVVGIVLRPFPFPESDRIVNLQHIDLVHGGGSNVVSPADYLAWRGQSASFERMAAFTRSSGNLGGVAEPERLEGAAVSPDFLPLLGVSPSLGRGFLPEEANPGRDGVIVLSYGLWQRRFGGDRAVLGRTLSLDDRAYGVVGVMPRDFEFPTETEYWKPLAITAQHRAWTRGRSWVVLARLKPGVSIEAAGVEMATIAARIAKEHPDTNDGLGVRLVRLGQMTGIQTRRFVMIGLAAAAFVLLLTCVNVSNLLLARAITRRHEMAVRSALGASRLRIARLFFTEALVLSSVGGLAGALLGTWGLRLSKAATPTQVYRWVPGLRNLRIDGTVLVATAAIALASGLACGVFAAWRATRVDSLAAGLAEDGRGRVGGHGRLRQVLVAAEVSLALVLLVAAGVMVRTYARMAHFEIGIDPRNVLQMEATLPASRYPDMGVTGRYCADVVRRLEAIPGVATAAASNRGGVAIREFHIVGQPSPPSGTRVPDLLLVTSGYADVVRLPVLKGRGFRKEDEIAEATTVALVSESVVRQYWRTGGDPIGATLAIPDYRFPPLRVIGVVGDVRDWFSREPRPTLYVLNAQMPQRSLRIFVRTVGDPTPLAATVRAQVQAVDPTQPVEGLRTMERDLWEQTSGVRLSAAQMGVFAGIALVLATTGTYGVVAFSVARRTQEMGVRMAMGARAQDVLRLVIGQSLRTTVIGLAIGSGAAFLLVRAMARALFGVLELESTVFLGVTLILAFCALLAAYLPARRAARVDAAAALRRE
jgi:putative ABC transport system permease protein